MQVNICKGKIQWALGRLLGLICREAGHLLLDVRLGQNIKARMLWLLVIEQAIITRGMEHTHLEVMLVKIGSVIGRLL